MVAFVYAFIVVKVFAFILMLAFVLAFALVFVLGIVHAYLFVHSAELALVLHVPLFVLVILSIVAFAFETFV